MSQLGHLRPSHLRPQSTNVRYAPLANKMVRRLQTNDYGMSVREFAFDLIEPSH
jgi:hypothetical protein